MNDEHLTPAKTSKLLNVTTRTLELWNNAGKISCFRTKGGHRRFLLSDVHKLMSSSYPNQQKICYCRVSTASQKEDLARQVAFFRDRYPDHTIVQDIGSGLNFKRKGFNSILDSAIKGNIAEVVVTHRDRLCRFGFELVERIIQAGHGQIVVLDQETSSPEKELVNDLVSIITVFSSRLYGLRSHQLKRQIRKAVKDPEDPLVPHEGTETINERDNEPVSLVL